MEKLENIPQPAESSLGTLDSRVLSAIKEIYTHFGREIDLLKTYEFNRLSLDKKVEFYEKLVQSLNQSIAAKEKLEGKNVELSVGPGISSRKSPEGKEVISIGSDVSVEEITSFLNGALKIEAKQEPEAEMIPEEAKKSEEKEKQEEPQPMEMPVAGEKQEETPKETDQLVEHHAIDISDEEKPVEPAEPEVKQEEAQEETEKVKVETDEEGNKQLIKKGLEPGIFDISHYRDQFIKMRTARAGIENDYKKGKVSKESFETSIQSYERDRKALADKIREYGIKTGTDEDRINEVLFEELIKKEHDLYLDAVKRDRGETYGDKAKEALRNLVGMKAVNWYLKLPRSQRIALNFALGTAVGLSLGVAGSAMGAAAYVGYRGGRVLGSSITSGVAGEWAAKKWSQEDLEKKEKEKEKNIKYSNESMELKAKNYETMREDSDKLKRKYALSRAAVTAAAGAGGGIIGGLAEGLLYGEIGKPSVLESKGARANISDQNRTPARVGYEPAVNKPEAQEPAVIKVEHPIYKIFDKPESLKSVELKNGDSSWRILGRIMEQNDDFKNLNTAQKQNVIAFFSNRVVSDPEKYGFDWDPRFGIKLEAGKTADFSKLFEDESSINDFKNAISKAKNLTEVQQTEILEREAKIETYIKTHPNEAITEDKVNEILSTKIEKNIEPEPEPETETSTAEAEPAKSATTKTLEEDKEVKEAVSVAINSDAYEFSKSTAAMSPEVAEPANPNNSIATAVAETGDKKIGVSPTRSMTEDAEFAKEADMSFEQGIDHFYGKKGLFGKTRGIDSKDWAFMKDLPGGKVLEYYTGDSANSNLGEEIKKTLTDSERHQKFLKRVTAMMGEAKGVVRPYENDTMEKFLKRLDRFLLEKEMKNAPIAA